MVRQLFCKTETEALAWVLKAVGSGAFVPAQRGETSQELEKAVTDATEQSNEDCPLLMLVVRTFQCASCKAEWNRTETRICLRTTPAAGQTAQQAVDAFFAQRPGECCADCHTASVVLTEVTACPKTLWVAFDGPLPDETEATTLSVCETPLRAAWSIRGNESEWRVAPGIVRDGPPLRHIFYVPQTNQ